jgi:hypothetical protein
MLDEPKDETLEKLALRENLENLASQEWIPSTLQAVIPIGQSGLERSSLSEDEV